MKPYSEQIAAINEAIKYKEALCAVSGALARSKQQEECVALRDAASTIIAIERDEKLLLAAGDLLEALEGLSELVSMSYAEYAKANIKAKKAIAKAKEGAKV